MTFFKDIHFRIEQIIVRIISSGKSNVIFFENDENGEIIPNKVFVFTKELRSIFALLIFDHQSS